MTSRYVILSHKGHGADHLDLMIDQGQSLATWQIDGTLRPEEFLAGVEARRIQDHRLAYLDYQGPISGGRGEVSRVDAGECEILRQDDDLWEVSFMGTAMRGTWRFARKPSGPDWTLEPLV